MHEPSIYSFVGKTHLSSSQAKIKIVNTLYSKHNYFICTASVRLENDIFSNGGVSTESIGLCNHNCRKVRNPNAGQLDVRTIG